MDAATTGRQGQEGARIAKRGRRKRTKKTAKSSRPNKTKDSRQRRNPELEIMPHIMPQPPQDADRFYVIEKLLERRFNEHGQEQYLVKWKNYGSEWNSWEPRNEIELNCSDMINEFNRADDSQASSFRVYCVCQQPYRFEQGGMIQCFNCLDWFHFSCIDMNMEEANQYLRYYCSTCQERNPKLKSIYKGFNSPASFYKNESP